MYKVFVNEKPIILTSSSKKVNNYPVYLFKDCVFDKIIHLLENTNTKGINLHCTDIEHDWNIFTANLKIVSAAGGLVLNPKKEVLFIYRNDTWDLPKGKIEKGETIETAAIREVEEECGIFNLQLIKPLLTTYHIYYFNGIKLKETYWFLMTSDYTNQLTPQLEEGITKVCFKNETEIANALQNSYENIKLVYDHYKES